MESAFYGYFFIKTKDISITWDTWMIEKFIEANGSYVRERPETGYKHNKFFCQIGLMKVKSYDSWNADDYNKEETNYISILTSKHPEKGIMQELYELAKFLNAELEKEIDECDSLIIEEKKMY